MTRLVLVHGAFAGAWCWEPVIPGLRSAGYDVEAIDLPGAGADPTPLAKVTLDAYAERICDVLERNEPAVLVGHSMGGMAITQAAARCPQHIAALIYVSAFMPEPGQSLLDLTALPEAADDQVQANLVVDGDPPIATMPAAAAPVALCHCATPEQAAWVVGRLGPQPVAAFAAPLKAGGRPEDFAGLPRAYVACLADRAIPPAMQRRMYQAAGCDPVIEIDADHFPFVSRTEELVAALDRIARGFASA
ncbi:MAG: alpha/beta fold hydrolase [Solirubrobacteraceae bacterium]